MTSLKTIKTDALETEIRDRFALVPRPNWNKELPKALLLLGAEKKLPLNAVVKEALNNEVTLLQIVEHLTVDESFFFRHSFHCPKIISLIKTSVEKKHRVIVFSAGCASGQEPYSIAMNVCQYLSPEQRTRISIVGCDVNQSSIAKAQAGIFHKWSLRNADPLLTKRFFKQTSNGAYEISDQIKQMVAFYHMPIQQTHKLLAARSVDLILFRNVSIYMERESLNKIYQHFYRLLIPGGFLFTAPSDQHPELKSGDWLATEQSSVFKRNDTVDFFNPFRQNQKVDDSWMRLNNIQKTFSSQKDQRLFSKKKRTIPPLGEKGDTSATKIAEHFPRGSKLKNIMELAALGQKKRALEIAGTLTSPSGNKKHLATGLVYFFNDDFIKATDNFRRAHFNSSEDPLITFWYAYSLHKCGEFKRAAVQWTQIKRFLAKMQMNFILSDGSTTAAELLRNVNLISGTSNNE